MTNSAAVDYLDDPFTRVEFDEGQIHTTLHDRNDGVAVFERWLDRGASGNAVTLADNVGAEIARRANAYKDRATLKHPSDALELFWASWTCQQGIPFESADEIPFTGHKLTEDQAEAVRAFCTLWDKVLATMPDAPR